MKTYQDLLNVVDNDGNLIEFIWNFVNEYKSTEQYREAKVADAYNRHRNVTITEFQKMLYTVTGEQVPDRWGADYKLATNIFHKFVIQENQFLLGNGITWGNEDTAEQLGDGFEAQVKKCGESALCSGVAYGFYDYDKLYVFTALEYAPIFDENNGAMRAGIRFWQIDPKKPVHAMLYETEGMTEFICIEGKTTILYRRKPYKTIRIGDKVDEEQGTMQYFGENYPTFPIVPLWANEAHQSELIGMREQIDCYDLIKSGYANNVDEASYIYWAIKNAGGMDDDLSLVKFIERMKTVHAAVLDGDGATAEAHTLNVPIEAREKLLDRLKSDMYDDFMAFDSKQIASGAMTATQIKANYEPVNNKVDDYEYQMKEFLKDILAIAGIDDEPTFTRSKVVNVQEEVNTVLAASQYLPSDYVTEKLVTLLGDGARMQDILDEMEDEDESRFINGKSTEPEVGEETGEENSEEV